MDAKTARIKALQIAVQQEQEREARNKKQAEERKQKQKEELRKFEDDLFSRSHEYIEYAVKEGKTKTSLYLASSDVGYENSSDWFLKNHRFAPGTERVMQKLKEEGFNCEVVGETQEHTTQHESSVPDYNYYTYSTLLKISW